MDRPACWSWPVPPLDGLGTTYRRLVVALDPVADRAAALLSTRAVDAGVEGARFLAFHAGRCAICGGGAEVDDHCHATGQVRGQLCSPCNLREGRAKAPLFVRYRRLHPAAILGYYEPYTGGGWWQGWAPDTDPAPWSLGSRPATLWPSWRRDDPLAQETPTRGGGGS